MFFTKKVICGHVNQNPEKILKNNLTNVKGGRIMVTTSQKEARAMLANKFYCFYYFTMGCPSFVNAKV